MLYRAADGAMELGRVSQVAGGEASLERLEEDAVNLVWRVSYEPEQRVPLSSVVRKVEADYMQVRQGSVLAGCIKVLHSLTGTPRSLSAARRP